MSLLLRSRERAHASKRVTSHSEGSLCLFLQARRRSSGPKSGACASNLSVTPPNQPDDRMPFTSGIAPPTRASREAPPGLRQSGARRYCEKVSVSEGPLGDAYLPLEGGLRPHAACVNGWPRVTCVHACTGRVMRLFGRFSSLRQIINALSASIIPGGGPPTLLQAARDFF